MPEISQFNMPEELQVDTDTATEKYAKFTAEPWEKGFGNTIGNALRRVMLSSLEGVAIKSVRIEGAAHEFSTVQDVMEDVTDIVLNLKRVKFRCEGELPRTLELYTDKAGDVTAADIREDGVASVLNPEQKICTLDKDTPLRMELELGSGRGYRPAEMNKDTDQPIGVIPMDCLFSPVERVRYDVQACRVGQRTDYESLELEVWTDGRQTPQEALQNGADILRKHLGLFVESTDEEDVTAEKLTQDEDKFLEKLCMPIKDIGLSARAKNCLSSAGIEAVGQLVQKTDDQMLRFRNFGKKSLDEIKKQLASYDLHIGMEFNEKILSHLNKRLADLGYDISAEEEDTEETDQEQSKEENTE